ncbi:glycosyltransferase family 4 protein [Pontixanthobacter sp.]|uniref:glycosyltransferase family 4 protein n=1 Tax=Pontixanthobacter sp. TaxID=2792078 RepID=UPI003C7A6B0D
MIASEAMGKAEPLSDRPKRKMVHLLDDFGMGGVVRALGIFQEPELAALSASDILPVSANTHIAPVVDADIIITHFPPSWARLGFFASLRYRNPAAKLIHVEHSYTRNFETLHVKSPRRFRLMLRLALRSFDQIVCVSNAQREWLAHAAAIADQRIQTVYPWSGRDELATLAPPMRSAEMPLRLAAYGRFDAIKNFGPLVDAVAAIGPAVELYLGGSGPQEAALVKKSLGVSNVTLCGQITDVGAFLGQADAVIVPSLRESYGLVATEARLAARPIIVSDADGLPEQVGTSGLSAPCSTAEEITAAIARFQAMPFAAMSRAARSESASLRSDSLARWAALLAD